MQFVKCLTEVDSVVDRSPTSRQPDSLFRPKNNGAPSLCPLMIAKFVQITTVLFYRKVALYSLPGVGYIENSVAVEAIRPEREHYNGDCR